MAGACRSSGEGTWQIQRQTGSGGQRRGEKVPAIHGSPDFYAFSICRSEVSLERKSHGKLDDSRVAARAVYLPEGRIDHSGIGVRKCGVVRGIVEQAPEFKVLCLREAKMFDSAKIQIPVPRTPMSIDARVSKSAHSIYFERRGIEPLGELLRAGSSSGEMRIADQIRSIRTDPAERIVQSGVNCKRKPGVIRIDAVELPAVEESAHDAGVKLLRERKVPHNGRYPIRTHARRQNTIVKVPVERITLTITSFAHCANDAQSP